MARSGGRAPRLRLRFPEREIARWAARQADPDADAGAAQIGRAARARGYLTRAEFLALCRWKTPRSAPRCARNTAAAVRRATAAALGATDERRKIDVLLALRGVGWPTASVILHFCDRRPYPILDVRALWSLGVARPRAHTHALWQAYARCALGIARRTGLDMRTVDRALWHYSKARQRRARGAGTS